MSGYVYVWSYLKYTGIEIGVGIACGNSDQLRLRQCQAVAPEH